MTKNHKPSSLNNRNVWSHSSRDQKPGMKALTGFNTPRAMMENLFFASCPASGVWLAIIGVLWLVDDALS